MKNYVLTNFQPYYLSNPIPQAQFLKHATVMSSLACAVKQDAADENTVKNIQKNIQDKMDYFAVKPKYISQRRLYFSARQAQENPSQTVNLDTLEAPFYENLLKNHNEPDGDPIEVRMEMFEKVVSRSVLKMYHNEQIPPDDMIHVTCSGYASPSPLQKLSVLKRWYDTTITHCYHMGCYASIPAMRMAHGFLSSSAQLFQSVKKKVDIVHTELLSTHSCLTDDSAEMIISKSLFGDGFIRYSLLDQDQMLPGDTGLKVLTLDEILLPDSLSDMTWKVKNHQFKMTLGIAVPAHIQNNITAFIERLCKNIGVSYNEDFKNDTIFAIHPGGPKIISNIASQLVLSDQQVQCSQKVLYENGNISSATIPTIFHAILNDPNIPCGKKIIAMAFGPGLTAAGGIFEKIQAC